MDTIYYRNPRLLVLTICLILVAGLSSFSLLPRMEDPELTQRFAMIKTRYPGASPERVETLVSDPIEEILDEIEEIKKLESKSNSEISIIQVELEDSVGKAEVDEVWSRVRDKLNDVQPLLPPGASEPEYDEIHPRAYAFIAGLTWQGEGHPNYAILRRLAEDLEDSFRSVAGTDETELVGDPQEEIVVEFDQSQLLSLGLTSADLSRQVLASDAKAASGQLRSSTSDLLFEVDSELDGISRIQDIPLQLGEEGQFTKLGNIADVRKRFIEPMTEISLVDGQPAIVVGAFVQSSFRVDLWANEVRAKLDEFQAKVPGGVTVDVLFDQSEYTTERLDSLMWNLLIGALAVVTVIFILMGWKSALLVGTALPLSTLMVLAGMRFLEIPLHQMSVTGLIIALGLLIDNAIVVVDEVRHRMAEHESPGHAISSAVRHLAMPLLGSTLTTAFAFAPIAMMPGPAGEFVGTIAVSVILALFSSLFVSLTIITAITGLLGRSSTMHKNTWWREGIELQPLARVYQSSLDFFFKRPVLGVSLALVLPVIGFAGGTQLQEQFFPPADRDQFHVEFELPSHTSIEETRRQVLAARELLMSQPEVTGVHWFLGKNAPIFYYNLIEDRQDASHFAQAIVQLKTQEGATEVIHRVQQMLDNKFPNAQTLVRQLEQGPPFDAPIEVRVFGPDLEKLRAFGHDVRETMATVPDVIHTRSDMTQALPKLGLKVDEEEAQLASLSNQSIANQLQATLEGRIGGSVLEGTEELPVRVRVAESDRGDLGRIMSMDLLPEKRGSRVNGENMNRRQLKTVPLSALAELQLQPENAVISRINGRRVNTVQGFITAGVLPQDVLDRFREKWDDSEISETPGYFYRFGGETAERNSAVGNLLANVGLLSVLMVATLVLSFGSFRMAGIIGVVGGMSVGLGLGALWMFGHPFGFMAIVGTMGLIGIAINDAIVVLAAIRDDEDAKTGDRAAVRRVVARSTRHVIATTITTMAGFMPLLLAGGGFWPPLAISIAGGVAGATILALYFVPSAYLLVICKACPWGARSDQGDSDSETHLQAEKATRPRASQSEDAPAHPTKPVLASR